VLSVVDVAARRRCGKSLAELGGIPRDDHDLRNFALSALLGVAYAASIGGLGTIIGSPPNGILVRFTEQVAGVQITFLDWMMIGVPAMLTFLPLAWFLNTFVLFRSGMKEIEGGREYVRDEWAKLGPMNAGERATLVVFAVTVALWMTAPLLKDFTVAGIKPFEGLADAGIAVGAAIALFLIRVKKADGSSAAVMDWETATKLPWGVLVLFGGGLALASATEVNGVPGFIGSLAAGFAGWPFWAILLAIITIMVFMSELTSNTAQVATMLPILAALGPVLGVPAGVLLVPATIAASCAFMMPVGTPPNAIVFGTGLIRMPDMMKAGLWLNLAGIALTFALTYVVFVPVLKFIR
jgi:sodium-dependent dicarboxylate transporter 2/3/5